MVRELPCFCSWTICVHYWIRLSYYCWIQLFRKAIAYFGGRRIAYNSVDGLSSNLVPTRAPQLSSIWMNSLAHYSLLKWLQLTSLIAIGVCAFEPLPLHGDEQQRAEQLHRKVQPLLEEHCLGCHSGAEPDAGLTLDHFDTPLDFLKGRSVWEKAIQKMEIKEMPPPDSGEISESDRKYLIS